MIYVRLFLLLQVLCCVGTMHAMFSRLSKAISAYTVRRGQIKKPVKVRGNTRSIWTPQKLKGMYTPLSKEAKPLSPVHGAAGYTSGFLQRMYATESEAPAIKLVKELFYVDGPQFKPTSNKSKPAYSLTPTLLGMTIGALETNKMQDSRVRQDIIDEWRKEHKILTDGGRLTQEKVNSLLNLIDATYRQDKNTGRAIL